MTASSDPLLAFALKSLPPASMRVSHRIIQPGDEAALLPEEAQSLPDRPAAARRASGAARIVARELLTTFGNAPVAVPRGTAGAPQWPGDIAGSLAHDDTTAVAAIGPVSRFAAIGIDIEPAIPLPPELLEMVMTGSELARLDHDPFRGRLHFAAKEAVYKAVNPLDGAFPDYPDIVVDLAQGIARVANGRSLRLRSIASVSLVAVAWVER